jgi:hypothetical protein
MADIKSTTVATSSAVKPAATKAVAKKPVVKKVVAKMPVVSKVTASKPATPKLITKPTALKPAAHKPIAKPAATAKPAAKLTPKVTAKKADKKSKSEKVKMERDSFTMPKDEYAQIAVLKTRLSKLGQPAKKSELLRAGIKLLAAMSDNTLKMTLAKIPVIKTGRPKKKS